MDDANWPTDQVSFTEITIQVRTFLQDRLDYGARAHHSNLDTPEINRADMAQAAVVTAALITEIANADSMLP